MIYLYKELGISFLNELSGMFAFCLVDFRKKKTWIVRDFFGIIPLFYRIKENSRFNCWWNDGDTSIILSNWNILPPAEKKVRWDQLCEELEANTKFKNEQEVKAVARFEARVQDAISLGASNRVEALRHQIG